MTGTLKLLSAALALQVAVAGVLMLSGRSGGDETAAGPLLAFERGELTAISLQGEDTTLQLRKQDERWVLPDHEQFPVNEVQLNTLLDKLVALQGDVPVATSREARERFRVSEDDYQRHLQLFSDDEPVASVYVGTSTGRGMSHVRLDGDDNIHSVRLASFDMPVAVNSWEDKTLLQFARDDVQQIALEGLTVNRAEQDSEGTDDSTATTALWQAKEGLSGNETLNQSAVDRLVGALASLRVERHVPQDEVASLTVDSNPLSFSVTLQGRDARRYELSKLTDEEGWLLRVSDQRWVLRIGQWNGQNIRDNAARSALIEQAQGESAPAVNETTDTSLQGTPNAS
jgi:hypothetical protein